MGEYHELDRRAQGGIKSWECEWEYQWGGVRGGQGQRGKCRDGGGETREEESEYHEYTTESTGIASASDEGTHT